MAGRKRRPPHLLGRPLVQVQVPHVIYLGIDPGASGGLAVLQGKEISAIPMPPTRKDVWDWFCLLRSTSESNVIASIEKVWGYVGTHVPGPSMFKLGDSFGSLCMALTASEIPYEEITPRKWQSGLGIPHKAKEETQTLWKNRLKAHAQRLFPRARVSLATADAILLAEYTKRKTEGRLG